MSSSLSPFGEKLRAWRRRRGMSQLDLALSAETTPRYVSFVETGRSRPGRDVVLRLAEALQLGLRDRNALLIAAGLPAVYSEFSLDHEELAPIRGVVERVLTNHNPYPAFAFAPGLRMLRANAAAERLFPGLTQLDATELITMWCTGDPDADPAQRRRDAYQVVNVLRRELVNHPHPDVPELLDLAEELARRHGEPVRLDPHDEDTAVMCGTLSIGGRQVRTVATVMRFDKPLDVTVAELRVELIFPADDAADAFFRELADV